MFFFSSSGIGLDRKVESWISRSPEEEEEEKTQGRRRRRGVIRGRKKRKEEKEGRKKEKSTDRWEGGSTGGEEEEGGGEKRGEKKRRGERRLRPRRDSFDPEEEEKKKKRRGRRSRLVSGVLITSWVLLYYGATFSVLTAGRDRGKGEGGGSFSCRETAMGRRRCEGGRSKVGENRIRDFPLPSRPSLLSCLFDFPQDPLVAPYYPCTMMRLPTMFSFFPGTLNRLRHDDLLGGRQAQDPAVADGGRAGHLQGGLHGV